MISTLWNYINLKSAVLLGVEKHQVKLPGRDGMHTPFTRNKIRVTSNKLKEKITQKMTKKLMAHLVSIWPASQPWKQRLTWRSKMKKKKDSFMSGFWNKNRLQMNLTSRWAKTHGIAVAMATFNTQALLQQCAKPSSSNHHGNSRMSLMVPCVLDVQLNQCCNRNRRMFREIWLMSLIAFKL